MTVAPRVVRAGLLVLVLALVGAGLFGLWHVVIGGLVNGNARAATFGVELAAGSGALLALVWVLRRRGLGG